MTEHRCIRLALMIVLLAVALASTVAAATARADCAPSSAKSEYARAWATVHDHFDAPLRPPPRLALHFGKGNGAWVAGGPNGMREVRVGDGLWKMLGGREGCRRQLAAVQIIVHEFAHVYQGWEVAEGITPVDMPIEGDPWWVSEPGDGASTYEGITEGLAEAWSIWAMRVDFGLTPADYKLPGYAKYDFYAGEMKEATTGAYIRRGQFREYLGFGARSVPF